jgi:predicted kinase
MRIISPELLLAQGPSRTYDSKSVGEAWANAHRALRSELDDPEVTTILVTVGTPGAGKSTWLQTQPDLDHMVAFDAVWADPKRRAAIAKRIVEAGREAIAVNVLAPLGVCLARNAERPAWRRVPEPTIRKAWADLQRFPVSADEGWTDVWTVIGTDVRTDRVTTEGRDRDAGRVFYRWRTEEDERVRPEHAKRHGRLFSWNYPPEGGHPGEDFNCRCEAELVRNDDVVETVDGVLRARPLTVPKWARRR